MIETIRSLLAAPQAYQVFWNMIGGPGRSKILVQEYIRPRTDDRILEIGCGPGTIIPYLPDSEYVGFDASAAYVAKARKRFPRAKFFCQRVNQYAPPQSGYFNIVLALGIVHHLDDEEASHLFQIAHDALQSGGKLVTLDGVWRTGQSLASRYLLSRDRGRFIRREEEYAKLASQSFRNVKPSIRHDLLRIPYTHIILECDR